MCSCTVNGCVFPPPRERERHTADIPIGAAVAGAAVLVDVFLCYLDMAKTAVLNDNRTR